jgi:hypothetical protein
MHAGILIIGSLLWKTTDKRRVAWRKERLNPDGRVGVAASIYYGRKSKTGTCTYTMTFGGQAGAGRAVLVPCTTQVDSLEDLIAEAQALWAAESMKAEPGRIGCARWGCVGAGFRGAAAELAPQWAGWFRGHATPVAAVDAAGLLRVPWPREPEASDIELMLATSTIPEPVPPTPEQIAGAWMEQGGEEYFFRNVENDIRTPDDLAIWRVLREAQAHCLNNAAYARALEKLRPEQPAAGGR